MAMNPDPAPGRLRPLPAGFDRTREALHRIAEGIVAPARKPDNEISLRATPGGFGTPVFEFEGAEHQVRVDGAELVHQIGEEQRRAPITTLRATAEHLSELMPEGAELDDETLGVDPEAARVLGEWYAFGASVLDGLRAGAAEEQNVTPPTLWPEHFDIAIEMGIEAEGRRANYGLSPGDEHHAEPYLYVGPWSGKIEGELWNGRGFSGAELDYSELAAAEDPVAVAIEFCRVRRRAIDAMTLAT